MRREFLAVLLDPVDGAARDDVDAALFHLLADMSTHIVIKAAQNVFAAIDQRHVAAIAGEDAGEFERDVAATLDDDLGRQRREIRLDNGHEALGYMGGRMKRYRIRVFPGDRVRIEFQVLISALLDLLDQVERGVRELHVPRARLFGSATEALVSAATAMVALECDASPHDIRLAVLGVPPVAVDGSSRPRPVELASCDAAPG